MRTKAALLASIAPASWSDESKTFDGVLVTTAPVRQRDGSFEIIDVAAIDAESMIGLPLLDSHRTQSIEDQHGVIVAARHEPGKLIITAHVDNDRTAARIKSGVLKSLSIGYRRDAVVSESVNPKSRARTQVVRVTPLEGSLVVTPADKGASIRKEDPMKKKAGANAAPVEDVEDTTPENENTVAHTRAEIRSIAKRAGLPADWADAQIDADATPEEARAAAFDAMQERSNAAPRVRILNPGPSPEETLHLRAEGFAARYLGVPLKNDAARPFANLEASEQARDMLEANGVRTRGMSRETMLATAFQTRAGQHTTSDFGLMLDVGLGSAVLAAYAVALSPAVPIFTQKVTANDFRAQGVHQLGELPRLSKVSESGEIKSVTRGEAREGWALDTYGAIFSASRKLIVNDAFNQLGDFARDAGQAAAATVADLVVSTLTQAGGAGPTMGDTVAMFHADHGNLFTAAATAGIDETGISAMRVAMLTQTGVDGVTIVDMRPDTLVVAPSRLTEAEKFVASITPTRTDDAQPIKLTVACEPRLEAVNPFGFYLADSRNPALYLGGLAGAEGPQVSARDGWEILGREWRVTLDVGVGARDFRGVAYNAGEDSNT